MVAGDAGLVELAQRLLVHQAQRGAEVDGGLAPHEARGFKEFLELGGGGLAAAGYEREAVDALLFVVEGLAEALVGWEGVVGLGGGVVVGRLGAPFAILGAAARLDVDDAAQVELAAGAGYGNLVGGGIEGLLVGAAGQPKGLLGRDVATGEDPLL